MTTGLDLVTSAMKKAGILSKTESPSADEAVDVLASMNAMLASWATRSGNVPYRTTEIFTLTAGLGTYTLGTGGTLSTTKPIAIIAAYTRNGTTDTKLTFVSDEEYAAIPDKSTTGTPMLVNNTNAYPLATLNFYPIPVSADTLYLVSDKKIGSYALTDTVSLPEGWERAIIFNTAIEIAPDFGVQTPQETVKIAADSLANIETAINRNRSLDVQQTTSNSDIYSGFN